MSTPRRLDHTRILPALVFIPLFYFLVRYAPPLAFFALVATVSILALWEFYLLFHQNSTLDTTFGMGIAASSLVLVSLQWPHLISLQMALGLAILLILTFQTLLGPSTPHSAISTLVIGFGVLYIVFTLGHLLSIRNLTEGEFLIFFVVLVTWASDTGGYYVGKLWGNHPLAPTLSPKKTVEGFIGGMALAILFAILAHFWFLPSLTLVDCLLCGVLLTSVGTLGDLSESAFKRHVGIKDSGGLIPGHGGMLDRLDSLLLTAPTFYYYMVFIHS
jgi:phosphatidate cytidylyltransferase